MRKYGNPIDVNFYLQKSMEIFDKNSADKIQSKKYQQKARYFQNENIR